MAEESPFQHFFATLGQGGGSHTEAVNAAPAARLEQLLRTPVEGPGRGILLRAPRAGYGKTHLIAKVQHRLSATHEFIPLTLLDGARLEPAAAVEGALRRMTRQLPAGGGLTALDLQARRILALALQPLVLSGDVPCQDREAALAAMRLRPVETFDFHQPHAVTAHWTRENFEVLGPQLALELSRRTGSSLNEISFWLAAMFRYAITAPDDAGRMGALIRSATNGASVERFAALTSLLSQILRVTLVADDLEGLHADPSGALRLGSFLASVRQEAPRVDAVVSVNDDIWSSSFQPALSGGLLDRIGELELRLETLDDVTLVALLEGRAPGRGMALFRQLTLSPDDRFPRRILRLAAERYSTLAPEPQPDPDPSPAPSSPEHAPEPASPEPVASSSPATPSFPSSPAIATQNGANGHSHEKESEPALASAAGRSVPGGEGAQPVASAAVTGDRIDDLLRQFRDRYGRD